MLNILLDVKLYKCLLNSFINFVLEAIAGLPASQSLEDITLDDDIDLEEELKAFLQPDEPDETLDKATNDENISEAGDPEEEKE